MNLAEIICSGWASPKLRAPLEHPSYLGRIEVLPKPWPGDGGHAAPHRFEVEEAWYSTGRASGGLSAWPGGIDIYRRGARMVRHSSSSSSEVFETRNLPFAAFLISGRHLDYLETRVEDGRGVFRFADPEGRGPKLEAEFHSGALAPATIFHSVVKRLRREIDMALAGQGGVR